MTVSLWVEASRDLEAENAQLALFEAQQRCADLWPFVALARSEEELGHRLAMIQDTVTERVSDPTLHEAVIWKFTENFQMTAYATDIDQDTGEDEAPAGTTSGLVGDGSSLQDQDGTPDITASKRPIQIWHAAKRQWITVTADAPGNPAYFSGGPEEGPNTGQPGTFPIEVGGPDPWNPINGNLPLPPTNVLEPANRFPAKPEAWTVPPDKAWVEHPMQFATGPGAGRQAKHVHADTPQANSSGFQPEQSNPYYFSEGQVGLASEEGAGFPVDLALPEPDERVDMYANAPSGAGHGNPGYPGEFAGPAVNYTNPPQYVTAAGLPDWLKDKVPSKPTHPSWMDTNCTGSTSCPADVHTADCVFTQKPERTAAKNNVAACATCGRPAYREGRKWHHLDAHLKGDHNVMLDADHPWVTEQMARTKAAAHKQANQYIKKDGDQWVITQKGTGKILSHHDSEEKANEAFRAMEWSKHSGSRSAFVNVHTAEGTDPTTANPFGQPAGTSPPMTMPAPSPPPAMTQGAPGAEAMPSMGGGGGHPAGTSTSNVPTTGSRPGGSSSIPTASASRKVAAFFHVGEDMVRGRPSSESPTGVPDEYTANTWEGPLSTHPRQAPSARGVNTPQQPGSPIPQISSSDNPGANERSAQEDDDDGDED
jgi:hypothetical protein